MRAIDNLKTGAGVGTIKIAIECCNDAILANIVCICKADDWLAIGIQTSSRRHYT